MKHKPSPESAAAAEASITESSVEKADSDSELESSETKKRGAGKKSQKEMADREKAIQEAIANVDKEIAEAEAKERAPNQSAKQAGLEPPKKKGFFEGFASSKRAWLAEKAKLLTGGGKGGDQSSGGFFKTLFKVIGHIIMAPLDALIVIYVGINSAFKRLNDLLGTKKH